MSNFIMCVLVLLFTVDLLVGIGIFNVVNSYTFGTAVVKLGTGLIVIYISLIIAIIGLIGAIVGLAGKKVGGALVLIAGGLWLIGGFLLGSMPQLWPLSGIGAWTGIILIQSGSIVYFISIEAILCILSGISILAGGDD
ncbi:MAG: hypothetical protein ACFFD2_02785 [Promethearchaeota archaeon]